MTRADVDDPTLGAFVPTTRTQLEQFEAAGSIVTLADGQHVKVRRHRDALNHMRRRETRGRVAWGLRRKAWDRYAELMTPMSTSQQHVLDRLHANALADPESGSVVFETADPHQLRTFADLLDQVRRRAWYTGNVGGAREVAVYIGALRVRADELAEDLC